MHIRSQYKLHRNHFCAFYIIIPSKNLNLFQQTNGVNNTDCDASVNSNSGCDVTDFSRASYGQFFEQQGGGIIAMKWDENDISVCRYTLCFLIVPLTTTLSRVFLQSGYSLRHNTKSSQSFALGSSLCNSSKYTMRHRHILFQSQHSLRYVALDSRRSEYVKSCTIL